MREKYSFGKKELKDAYKSAGSILGASRILGVSRGTFKRYCRKLGIDVHDISTIRRKIKTTKTPEKKPAGDLDIKDPEVRKIVEEHLSTKTFGRKMIIELVDKIEFYKNRKKVLESELQQISEKIKKSKENLCELKLENLRK